MLFQNWLKRIKKLRNYILVKYNYKGKMKKDFKKTLGYKLNLDTPKTFNEKIQWMKLYYRHSTLTIYADKYKVRAHIKKKIGGKYLIEQYGVFKDIKDINIDTLPDKFVLKPNHGAGKVIICLDKTKMNWEKEFENMAEWLKENYYYVHGEWQYKDIPPLIICEKLLEENIIDYKIFCFNGEPRFIQVIGNRLDGNYYCNYYDLNWDLMDVDRADHGKSSEIIPKPLSLGEMLEVSRIISKEFPFVRVDLYDVNGQVYFGEATFTPANGLTKFIPEKYDSIFGSYLTLPEMKKM